MAGLHRLPGERPDPARAPAQNTGAEQRAEQSWNGVLEPPRHHPDSGEDETAEADDRTGVDGKGAERAHQRRCAGEVHRPLRVSGSGEGHREESRAENSSGTRQVLSGAGERRLEGGSE